MTPAQAKAQREALRRDIRREEKRKDRARLVALRAQVRKLRAGRARAIREARAACSRRRAGVPTLREAAAMLRAARAEARGKCDVELARAAKLKTDEARARAEEKAEKDHQRALRRIERANKRRTLEDRPRLAKGRVRAQESDDEVLANIPPELVYLFERVKRQIKGADRLTRTEAFLQYAHDHPDEELAALEDRTDALIAELEARERGGRRRASNPRQPPAAWWDGCIARVTAAARVRGSRIREPRAVCGAAWWKMKPQKRAAIVRALERSRNPRAKAAALVLARAEKKHHGCGPCKPERRSNPRELVSLVYLEQKPGDREPYEYEHEFAGELPELTMRGGKAQIRGGSYESRGGWLEG